MAKKGDYVLASTADHKKPFLMKVSGADRDEIRGIDSRFPHMQELRIPITIKPKEVLVNLGSNPLPGKVYGTDTSFLYQGKREHEKFGDVHFFYKAEKETAKALFSAMNIAYKRLDKNGLADTARDSIVYEILGKSGDKYAGMYIRSKSDKIRPRIQLKPEKIPADQLPYVFLHEFAHHLHFTYAQSVKLNSKWIKLFNTSIKLTSINKNVSEQLLDALLNGETPPSKFRSELDEDLQLAYKWILRYISQTHSISVKELDVLFEAEDKEEIKALWPIRSIPKKDLEPVISLYACKNYKETVAESLSFYLCGIKLPKDVTKLVEKTLSYIKTQIEKDQ